MIRNSGFLANRVGEETLPTVPGTLGMEHHPEPTTSSIRSDDQNPEKLEERITDFLKQRLPTGFKEFTYQSINEENQRLKAELALLKKGNL